MTMEMDVEYTSLDRMKNFKFKSSQREILSEQDDYFLHRILEGPTELEATLNHRRSGGMKGMG